MKNRIILLLFILVNFMIYSKRMPIYVTPLYNSDPFEVNVGKYSEDIKKMNAGNYLEITGKIKADIDNTNIEALYVLSVRLYDINKKYEALYWFYSAQMRARIFMNNLDPDSIGSIGSKAFELKAAFNAFNQLAGQFINGHAFGNIEKAVAVMQMILDDNKKNYSPAAVYPDIKFLTEADFIKTQNEYLDGCRETMDYMIKNKAEVYRIRKENGVEGKY